MASIYYDSFFNTESLNERAPHFKVELKCNLIQYHNEGIIIYQGRLLILKTFEIISIA